MEFEGMQTLYEYNHTVHIYYVPVSLISLDSGPFLANLKYSIVCIRYAE